MQKPGYTQNHGLSSESDTQEHPDSCKEDQPALDLELSDTVDLEEVVAEHVRKLAQSLAAEHERLFYKAEASLRQTARAASRQVGDLRKRFEFQSAGNDKLHDQTIIPTGDLGKACPEEDQVIPSELEAGSNFEDQPALVSSAEVKPCRKSERSTRSSHRTFALDEHWCNDTDCAAHHSVCEEMYRLALSKKYEADMKLLLEGHSRYFPDIAPAQYADSTHNWTRSCIKGPSSPSRLIWNMIGTLVLSIDGLRIPLQVFRLPKSFLNTFLELASTIYWTIDMIASSLTGYVDKAGALVTNPIKVLKNYLLGWFLLDALTVVVDWIEISMGGQDDSGLASIGLARLMRVFRVFRLIRILRLLRVRKLRSMMIFFQEKVDSERMMIMLRLLQNILGIVALNHFLACFWYWLGSVDVQGYPSWVNEYSINRKHWFYGYLTSMHWSLTQFTPASMSVQPQNVYERVFAILLILFAMIIFSSFVSAVTNSMMRLWTLGAGRREELLQFRKFLRQNAISQQLSYRLNRYLQILQVAEQNVLHIKNVKLIPSLSVPLQQELRAELLMRYVGEHPLFVEISILNPQLLRKICSECINDKFLSRGDVVFIAGQISHEMYFVSHGVAAYTLSSGDVPAEGVFRGDWFSEPSLWTRWMHLGHMQATLECELVGIHAGLFQKLALAHPISLQMIRTYAGIFIVLLNSKSEEGSLSDLLSDLTTSEQILTALPKRKMRTFRSRSKGTSDSSTSPM